MFNKSIIAVFIMAAGAIFFWNPSLEARCCGPRVSINFGALFCPPPPPCPVYRETYVCYPCVPPPRYIYSAPCYPCCPPPCEQVVIYDRPYTHYYPYYR